MEEDAFLMEVLEIFALRLVAVQMEHCATIEAVAIRMASHAERLLQEVQGERDVSNQNAIMRDGSVARTLIAVDPISIVSEESPMSAAAEDVRSGVEDAIRAVNVVAEDVHLLDLGGSDSVSKKQRL